MLSVTASGAKQSPGLRGDCFVAKNAPRNDNYTKTLHCQTTMNLKYLLISYLQMSYFAHVTVIDYLGKVFSLSILILIKDIAMVYFLLI